MYAAGETLSASAVGKALKNRGLKKGTKEWHMAWLRLYPPAEGFPNRYVEAEDLPAPASK